MNGDWEDRYGRIQIKNYKAGLTPKGKINSLLTELIEKEDEIAVYKNRLKELETAFYYNLEIISERDLEITILEKQLDFEKEQLQNLIRERNELEDLVKVFSDKNNKKIKHLEAKLSLKEEEIRHIQRENLVKVNSLKGIIDDVKHQQEKKLYKMSTKFETQKKELVKSWQEEMEEKEKYYLLEIDNLAGKLAQACLEKEELVNAEEETKNHLEELKNLFIEKENQYLEEIQRKSFPTARKTTKETQCEIKPQVLERKIQAQPDTATSHSQTVDADSDLESDYLEKINLLQEQNEVLKYIVKDLKRNRDRVQTESKGSCQPPGCECSRIRTEIKQVKKKFEREISNLKEILEEGQKRKADEDVAIQSLEKSVTCLKDKLLLGLQEKLSNFEGEDICTYTYNREIQNEIQVTLLEQKLSHKLDSFMSAAEEENKKVHQKLEELKKECAAKLESSLKPRHEPQFKSENILEKIRLEKQKLENKIETDMKNLVRNNFESNKCDKNLQTRVDLLISCQNTSPPGFPKVLSSTSRELYCRNDLSPRKYISVIPRQGNFQNQIRERLGQQREVHRVTNNLVMGGNKAPFTVKSSLN